MNLIKALLLSSLPYRRVEREGGAENHFSTCVHERGRELHSAAVSGADDIARHPELAHAPRVRKGLASRGVPPRRSLLAHRLAVRIAGLAVRATRSQPAEGPAKVTILLVSAYNAGGIVRSVLNLAGHLAEDREVEVVSIFRNRTRPYIPIPENVKSTVLHDRRKDPPGGLRGRLI